MILDKKWLWLLPICLMLFIFSCKKGDSDFTPEYKYDYFPVDTGHYVIYEVDSITFDNNFNPPRSDTNSYQIREYYESTFTDNEGREAVRIERYSRKDSTQAWRIKNAWYAVLNQTSAERVEENLRFIKLVFPPSEGETWTGNKFLDLTENLSYYEDWEYTMTEVDVAYNLNGLNFDETLSVLHVMKKI